MKPEKETKLESEELKPEQGAMALEGKKSLPPPQINTTTISGACSYTGIPKLESLSASLSRCNQPDIGGVKTDKGVGVRLGKGRTFV
ncbi:MAG: hypothetical protein GY696_23755 [Gammaproteobacteria bacterium]|nr:hypothetical protein [Gammaproteobacteria bacterium]